jgi:ribosomal RNA-processing protein 9
LQPGYINCLAFAPSGKFLVAGIGQEHRLGRWERIKAARNEIRIIPLVGGNDGQEEDGDNDEDSEKGDEVEAQGSDDE